MLDSQANRKGARVTVKSQIVLEQTIHRSSQDAERAGVFEAFGGFIEFLERELDVFLRGFRR